MSYIGNQPTSVAFLTDSFNGTGSQTAFTMTVAPANPAAALVAVSGVLQAPSTYSVSGTTLTFSAAPPSGTGNISVRYLGVPASNIATTAYRTVTELTATAGQTTFTPASYNVGFIDVYRNGVLLGSADFTATNGTTVVLATACVAGELVAVESFYVSSVLNAIPATPGAVSSNYIQNSPTFTGTTTTTTLVNTTLNAPSGVLATQNGMTGIAKAWVQFAGSSAAIAGSFNVSSVTRVAAGVFTVNFTTAQANANYAYNVNASPSAGYAANPGVVSCNANGQTSTLVSPTTSAFTFTIYNLGASNFLDALQTNVIVCGS